MLTNSRNVYTCLSADRNVIPACFYLSADRQGGNPGSIIIPMKLFFKNILIGTIEALSIDGVWVEGTVVLNKDGEKFRELFDYLTDEQHGWEEPPFDADLLADDNWFVEDASGERKGISLPAVSSDGSISWRWC